MWLFSDELRWDALIKFPDLIWLLVCGHMALSCSDCRKASLSDHFGTEQKVEMFHFCSITVVSAGRSNQESPRELTVNVSADGSLFKKWCQPHTTAPVRQQGLVTGGKFSCRWQLRKILLVWFWVISPKLLCLFEILEVHIISFSQQTQSGQSRQDLFIIIMSDYEQ